MANRSPPTPLPVGSISPSAALAAIAASAAEPPAFITSSATWVASGCEVAAIACGAITSERVANGWPVMRSAPSSGGVAMSRADRSRTEVRRMAEGSPVNDDDCRTIPAPRRVFGVPRETGFLRTCAVSGCACGCPRMRLQRQPSFRDADFPTPARAGGIGFRCKG